MKHRPRTLQHAASVLFALISVVPLLVFAYSLHSLDAIDRPAYQTSLFLALGVAVLGFAIFRVLMSRISDLLRSVYHAAARVEPAPAGVTAGNGAGPDGGARILGFGAIAELGELADAVNRLWRHEAEAHQGRRVVLSLKQLEAPVTGTLLQADEHGVVLEVDGTELGISYRRFVALEAVAD